jgi:hypothetical protein
VSAAAVPDDLAALVDARIAQSLSLALPLVLKLLENHLDARLGASGPLFHRRGDRP